MQQNISQTSQQKLSSHSDDTSSLHTLDAVRRDVNKVISDHYASKRSVAAQIAPRYIDLWDAKRQYVLAGGKRIRPYLTVLAYEMFAGSEYDKIIRVAAAVEILNQAMLIHDDIIDRDYVRYGVPNVAGQFAEQYAKNTKLNDIDRLHLADAAALLAGDLAIADTFAIIGDSGFSSDKVRQAHAIMQESIFVVVAGELLDTETITADLQTTDPLEIARLKTAVYSVEIPLTMGATLAGADAASIAALRAYGENLGIAYQLTDDLLGVFGDAGVTGKTTIGDLREGKLTYLMQQTWSRANNDQRDRILKLLGKPDLQEAEADVLRNIIVQSGGKQSCEDAITNYANRALSALVTVSGAAEGSLDALRVFTEKIIRRRS